MARKDDDDGGPQPPRPPTGSRPRPPAPPRPRPPLPIPPIPTRPPPVHDVPTTFDHARWEQLHDEQLGIDPRDPDGHVIGNATCERKFGPIVHGGWKPVKGSKRVLVGDFDHYNFYNPIESGDEADFNIFITPDPPFRYILDDVVAKMSADQRKELQRRKRGPGYCVECEVTPDEEYYDNRWFRCRKPYTAIGIGSRIGVYGPWVRDLGHGGRPEIHPCEVIWTRNGSFDGPGWVRHMMWKILVVQDDSNRFDRYANYSGVPLRPWSQSPRRAHLTVCLQALVGKHAFCNVNVTDGHRVFEHPGEEAARHITREHDGDPVLTVSKRMSRPAQVKMRLSDLSPDPGDVDKLRTFLDLDVQVGEGDRGTEGFAELTLEYHVQVADPPGDSTPTPTPPPPPNPVPPGSPTHDPDRPDRHEP